MINNEKFQTKKMSDVEVGGVFFFCDDKTPIVKLDENNLSFCLLEDDAVKRTEIRRIISDCELGVEMMNLSTQSFPECFLPVEISCLHTSVLSSKYRIIRNFINEYHKSKTHMWVNDFVDGEKIPNMWTYIDDVDIDGNRHYINGEWEGLMTYLYGTIKLPDKLLVEVKIDNPPKLSAEAKAEIPKEDKKSINNIPKQVYIINGVGGAGKDEFARQVDEVLLSYYDNSLAEYSYVDYAKELALDMGWDGSKSDKDRKFLADLNNLMESYADIPFKETIHEINEFLEDKSWENVPIMFVYVRKPKDIQRIINHYPDVGIKTILIKNNNIKNVSQNGADNVVNDYKYDYVIDNTNDGTDGDLDDLRIKAKLFCLANLTKLTLPFSDNNLDLFIEISDTGKSKMLFVDDTSVGFGYCIPLEEIGEKLYKQIERYCMFEKLIGDSKIKIDGSFINELKV